MTRQAFRSRAHEVIWKVWHVELGLQCTLRSILAQAPASVRQARIFLVHLEGILENPVGDPRLIAFVDAGNEDPAPIPLTWNELAALARVDALNEITIEVDLPGVSSGEEYGGYLGERTRLELVDSTIWVLKSSDRRFLRGAIRVLQGMLR